MTFTLTSSSFKDGGTLPDAQVKAKGDRSPHLRWSGAPEGTKTFANIPADVTELAEGASPDAMPPGCVEGRTDYGPPGFGGAAPPPGHGPHRYIVTVFAVDTDKLDVTPDNSGAVFGFNLHFHTLAKASITATYENTGD